MDKVASTGIKTQEETIFGSGETPNIKGSRCVSGIG
jgi:hypothetical protein